MDFLKSRYTELMVEANPSVLNAFKHWLFCPGMLFDSPGKWWGDLGRRDWPHEGLDFCLYQRQSGKIVRLDPDTRIPVIQDGVVRAVFADYLGRAVIVEHVDGRNDNRRWLSVYAHTAPLEGIAPGVVLKKGAVIATIADTSQSKAGIFAHLHVSLGLPSPRLCFDNFVWNRMRDPGLVALLDPLAMVEGHYKVLDNCSDDHMLG